MDLVKYMDPETQPGFRFEARHKRLPTGKHYLPAGVG
jgi:hypothetical protein